jgi:hypothetical protein
MSERPKCELGHELDFIGHNHIDPDQLREHVAPDDGLGRHSMEVTIANRKAYIREFNADQCEKHGHQWRAAIVAPPPSYNEQVCTRCGSWRRAPDWL